MTVVEDGIFPPLREAWSNWLVLVIVVFTLFVLADYSPTPEQMEMRLPPVDDPVMWFTFALAAVLIIWSWSCGGSDHEENVDPEHPDGRLTYPGDEK